MIDWLVFNIQKKEIQMITIYTYTTNCRFICLRRWNYMVVAYSMVFNVTFNNISAISWWWVLLVEETRVPGENPTCCKSNNVVSSTPRLSRIQIIQLPYDHHHDSPWNYKRVILLMKTLICNLTLQTMLSKISAEFFYRF